MVRSSVCTVFLIAGMIVGFFSYHTNANAYSQYGDDESSYEYEDEGPEHNPSAFNLGLNFGYHKGNHGGYPGYAMPVAQAYPVMSPMAMQPFGGAMGAYGSGFMQSGMFSPVYMQRAPQFTPGGAMAAQYFPWARPSDSYSANQLGIGAAQWNAPLPPDITVQDMYGNVITQSQGEESRFMHEIAQAVRGRVVAPYKTIQPPDYNQYNDYRSFYDGRTYPIYNRHNHNYPRPTPYPDPGPGPIPGPIPGPDPFPSPQPSIGLPGGNGGAIPII